MSRSTRDRLKRALAPLRPRLKPGIVVVGAQKAGTSALYRMLIQHPSIIPPVTKELNFFNRDKDHAKGSGHYAKLLPLRPVRGKGWITVDATPGYLYHPQAAERLHRALPNAIIVAILRDPVLRAYSDWNMFRRFKDNPAYAHLYDARTFEEAMQAELATAPDNAPYLSRGYYAQQLKRYFSVFPKEQVMVFPYPRFKKEPDSIVSKICSAAGLVPVSWDGGLKNVKANINPYLNPIPQVLREELSAHFKPHEEALWELLGEQLQLSEE
jgi:hypothetical protein